MRLEVDISGVRTVGRKRSTSCRQDFFYLIVN
uniref:Uncharacterized protein n=1 Tax=Heterorhabditis bacteriophora TaxID=37862 RepID=A0A1I7WI54_HETBA